MKGNNRSDCVEGDRDEYIAVWKDALRDIAAASMRSPVGSLMVVLITLTQHLLRVEESQV